jgi:peroxiredoxin
MLRGVRRAAPRGGRPARLRAPSLPGRGGAAFAAFLLLSILPAAAGQTPSGWSPREGAELLGTPAPPWTGIRWIQGGPLTLEGLRGKVVLLRFWLTDCPYCERTAPALRELDRRYRDRGLVVVAVHHPKSDESRDPERVARAARDLGFTFPVGIDDRWETLQAYGVGSHFRRFTSVSFVIDASGIIRFVHDGGEYHPGGGPGHRECNAAYEALDRTLRRLLPESPPGESP